MTPPHPPSALPTAGSKRCWSGPAEDGARRALYAMLGDKGAVLDTNWHALAR